jgi:hypothetical protein
MAHSIPLDYNVLKIRSTNIYDFDTLQQRCLSLFLYKLYFGLLRLQILLFTGNVTLVIITLFLKNLTGVFVLKTDTVQIWL